MVKRSLLPPIGLLVATLSACGGTDNGRPSGKAPEGAGALPCDAANGYTSQVFIDFEGELRTFAGYPDPRTAAACNLTACQASPFFFNFDVAHTNEDPTDTRACGAETKTGCDCQLPTKPDVVPSSDPAIGSSLFGRPIEGGRCSAPGNAMHLEATNIATCYGSNGRLGWGAGVDIKFDPSGPLDDAAGAPGSGGASGDEAHAPGSNGYDARAWDGISFWVRKGNLGSNSTLIVTVADPGTTPAPPEGCSDAETAPDAEKCDAFGVAVTLSEEWTFVPALFRSMRQKGFGKPSPLGYLDSGNLVKIQLLLGPGDWDLWIDDVAFFRDPEANP